jgi:membrane protein involved in colicin uptake
MLIGVRSGDSYTEADRSVIESAEQKIRDEKKAAANAEKAAKAQQRAKDKLERQAAQKAKAEAAEAAKAATQVVTATVVDETVNNAPVVTETPVASVN